MLQEANQKKRQFTPHVFVFDDVQGKPGCGDPEEEPEVQCLKNLRKAWI